MTAEMYVNKIAKKIKCSGAKKKEIKKQLLTDIKDRLAQGENLETVFAQMGTVEEIAYSFNESTSPLEQKKYKRNRIVKIVSPIILILLILVGLVYWVLPKGSDIESSEYFSKSQVEEAMKNVVELLNEEDYSSLQEEATSQMASALNKNTMEKAKEQVGSNWGTQEKFGTAYIQEFIQKNEHFAMGQMTVTYENVSVTYTITFDSDMKLAGLYLK